MSERPGDEDIERAIVRYLEDHPHAMDTMEGIAEWWLTGYRRRVDATTLARVLRRLVDRGVLEQLGTGTHTRYRLMRRSAGED